MTKILITGPSSLIAESFFKELVTLYSGYSSLEICFFSRSSAVEDFSFLPFSLTNFNGNCSNINHWISCLTYFNPDVVIHIAQMRFVSVMINAFRSLSLSPKFIIIGSTGIFSKYSSCSLPYSSGEQLLVKSNFDFVILRPSMIYGSFRDRNMHRLVESALLDIPFFLPSSGSSLFQPVYYQDVGHALFVSFVRVLDCKISFPSFYNVVGPTRISLFDVVSLIKSLTFSKSCIFKLPHFMSRLFYYILLILPNFICPITSEQVLRLSEDKVFGNDWPLIDINHNPVSFYDGINILVNSYKSI